MNKICTVKRSLLMLLLIALWSAGAYADGVFSIRIEDFTIQLTQGPSREVPYRISEPPETTSPRAAFLPLTTAHQVYMQAPRRPRRTLAEPSPWALMDRQQMSVVPAL